MGFEIFSLRCGAGLLALSPLPGAVGALQADVQVIAEWGADLVVSMTAEEEVAALGVGQWPASLRDVSIAWRGFPVVDFAAPAAFREPEWRDISAAARETLALGGKVLVHCRGGCGRSGMAVLRLMVESGEDAQTALKRLRAVRPCAVETDDQMVWATLGALSGD